MKRREKDEPKQLINSGNIIHYLALSVIFAAVIFGVKMVVLGALAASPTKQAGNGIISLFEVHNTGAAFNLFSAQPEVVISFSFIALAALIFVAFVFSTKLSKSAISSMALLTAGIAMNFYERVTQGFVIDYIHLDFMQNFPVFNTADIMIVCGALGIVIALLTKD